MQEQHETDVRYEWRAILLLTLGFGLVGLDRFAINPLFPSMMEDLNLDYQDLGNISSFLSVAWGIAAAYMGQVSDRLGRRRVLIPAVIVFSCMAGFTGLVTGIASLLALRVVMGLAEGAFMPASIAATIEASKPSRRGFNFGLQQNGLAVVGLGLGPILATQLLVATGSWRWVFCIVAIPGLVLAYAMYKVIRDTQGTVGSAEAADIPQAGKPSWKQAFGHRNVVLACVILVCMAGAANIVIAMTPSYLVDYLSVDSQRMGFIVSANGLGALIGGIALSALSDRLGRKPVMLCCGVVSALALWAFMASPAEPVRLFVFLAAFSGTLFSVIYINNGPLTVESVPASIASTAVGIVVGVGEIVGGGIAPSVAGFIAKTYGIQHVFSIALAVLAAAVVAILLIREPRKATRRAGETDAAGEVAA